MTFEWQRRREMLNHRWLVNRFLLAQVRGSLLVNLESDRPSARTLSEFADTDWPCWAGKRRELAALLEDAEEALSPKRLLEEPPLSRQPPEVRAWLSGILHAIWRHRWHLDRVLAEAQDALAEADRLYRLLCPLFSEPDRIDIGNARAALPDIRAFEAAILRLTRSIHELPNGVQLR